jgi:uncharacterized protein
LISLRFDTKLILVLVVASGFGLGGCTRVSKETQTNRSAQPAPEETAEMIAALRAAYAAFNRGDIDAALTPMDASIEWSEPPEFPGGGSYHGREGVKRYLTQSRAGWAEGASEPERFITAGNRIVVFVHARIRMQGSKDWNEVRLADVYTVRDGKAVQMLAFADRHEALRWVGISEPQQ